MPFVTSSDSAQIYYKDWGTGQPVVFSHGWPLTADAWDDQMFLARTATAASPMTAAATGGPASPGTATTSTRTPTT